MLVINDYFKFMLWFSYLKTYTHIARRRLTITRSGSDKASMTVDYDPNYESSNISKCENKLLWIKGGDTNKGLRCIILKEHEFEWVYLILETGPLVGRKR